MSIPNRFGPILVAHSYYLRYDEKQVQKMRPYAPLATLIVAATLRNKGFDVRFFDAMLSAGGEEFVGALEGIRPAAVAIVEDNFNFLTKMCTLRMREAALDMIAAAKVRGIPVVVNGSDATDHTAQYLAAGADVALIGEPERSLEDVLVAWEAGVSDLSGIPGLAIPGAGADRPVPTSTPPRPYLKDLDALPFPAWDLVDVDRYRSAWLKRHGRLSWSVVTSRGCPYRCNWCAKPIFGTRYVQRSPADVAEEVRLLKQDIAPDHLWFADDIFGLTEHWITSFAEELAARGAQTPFMMQTRANLLTPSVVKALRESGAEEVWIGVESGAQHILDAMDKGTTVEQVRSATQALKSQGIRTGWFLQLGYPGEEWDDILLTRNLVRQERPDDIGVSVAYPMPGTEFFNIVQEDLGHKRNWVDSGELAMMFRGTFSTSFYREIRDLLHTEVVAGPSRDTESRWISLAERALRVRSTR